MGAAEIVEEEVAVVGWSRTRGLKPRRPWWLERAPPLEGGSEGWKLKFMAVGVESAAMPPAACPRAIAIAALPGDGNIALSLCVCVSLSLCQDIILLVLLFFFGFLLY